MTSSETPKTVGRYQIVRPLGAGAMGEVVLALDPNIDRYLAIKTVRLVGAPTEVADRKQRLLREAKAAGRLLHPNVVTLFDAGEHEGLLYLAFEYVEGQDLSHRMKEDPPLYLGDVLRIVKEVASALDAAHQQGIVHRDIKPSNLLIGPQGEVKVADFGIAKLAGATTQLTQTGSVVGSPQYMSPEQIRGEALDGRSDLFSLGVVFYELLGQRRPFDGDTLSTLVFQILSQEPIAIEQLRPPLPPRLGGLVRRLLAKAPTDRFASAGELIRELDTVVASLSPDQLAISMTPTLDLSEMLPPTTQLPPSQTPSAIPPPPPLATAPPPVAAPPPTPPAPQGSAPTAVIGTYAVPAAKGRKLPLILTGIAVFILAAGWFAAQLFQKGPPTDNSTSTAVVDTSANTPADPTLDETTPEPTTSPEALPPASKPNEAAESPNSEPDPAQDTEPEFTSPNPRQPESAPEANNSSSITPPVASAGLQTPPPPQPATQTPPNSQEAGSGLNSNTTTAPPPPKPRPATPPPRPAPVPPTAPPQTQPEVSAESVDPDLAKFDRFADDARIALETGLKLRFDVEPDDAYINIWRRGDRRGIVHGPLSKFNTKKKGQDLELPATGTYLLRIRRDGLPNDTIFLTARSNPQTATVIRSNLRQLTQDTKLVRTGRSIAFKGQPADAKIFVDDKEVGRASQWPGAPLPNSPRNLRLKPGAHTLRIEAPGYEPQEFRVEVGPNARNRKRLIEYSLRSKGRS